MRLPTKNRAVALASAIGLLALGVACYLVLRPALQIKDTLRLMAAIRVGQTSVDELRRMAIKNGVRSHEVPEIDGISFYVSQRNRVLEFLHLAPRTIVGINAKVTGGIVTLITVRAWLDGQGLYANQYANISINEFDTRNTGCGDAPVCIKPYSSTTLTSVYFVPSTPIALREHLFSLNSWCLAKIGGCKNSREFFPPAWDHDAP
jgi:hypothetical protein